MPIYEYECTQCGHQLDALQGINEPRLSECPACNKTSLKRLISAPNFRLKGKGWYETDFKTGNRKNLAENKDDSSVKKDKTKEDKTKEDKTKKTPEKNEKVKDKTPKDKTPKDSV
ncbi:MAG TPA: zinc ribbon domain-containing protein [Gammaproteobacteria bacterium]|jgi:putative FmdB family regulatory protein|nr:zinc ribbon domain-containing protein [Gammaproteobacteria bacterium]HIK76675.1 zinc ribbon domain-containing protein [Gammaproteobacteria bacterium]